MSEKVYTLGPAAAAGGSNNAVDEFVKGLVFGFDLGTVATAHAVRKKNCFAEAGVIECPSETAALAGRRKLRNGRRVMDHRQDRRDWFAGALASVLGLSLHKNSRLPVTSWESVGDGLWKPVHPRVGNPLALRVAALNGNPLSDVELFAALTHLVKRRGPQRPPWAESLQDDDKKKDEEEEADPNRITPEETQQRFDKARAASVQPENYHPCHYLAMLARTKQRQRNHAWPRLLMRAEAAAILKAQAKDFPVLEEKREVVDVTGEKQMLTNAEWLLRGNSALVERAKAGTDGEKESFPVFFRNHRNRERAPFTFQAARIHNRGPGEDLIHPRREDGRPNYVMSRSRQDYRAWQTEVALIHFKVVDLTSRKKKKGTIKPPASALAQLRDIIQRTGRLSVEDLKAWVAPYEAAGQFALIEGQTDLVGKGEGRGKFGKHGLAEAVRIVRQLQEDAEADAKLKPKTKKEISKNKTEEDKAVAFVRKQQPEHVNMAPRLRFNVTDKETKESQPEPLWRALRRFINEIRDPVVQHRVRLFDHTLDDLVERHGVPDHIIVECVRELGDDPEKAAAASQRREEQRKESKLARDTLADMGVEATDKNIRKFRLLQECKWRCPYDPDDRFMQSEFDDLVLQRLVPPTGDPRRSSYLSAARTALSSVEVEHMVPQSTVVCDDWYNVTVTRRATNEAKGNRIPYEFVLRDADEARRKILEAHAEGIFGKDSLKYKIFTSPDARTLIESTAHLQRTAYIARCVRYVCLLKFGWLTEDGRDPLQEKGHGVNQRYLVSNGGLTHRLRKAWKLDELLYDDRMTDEEWDALSQEDRDALMAQRRRKNRQDLRHHVLDAMLVSCTLPWAVNSPDYAGGWCHLDPEDSSVTSVRCPIFGEAEHGQEIKRLMGEKLEAIKNGDPADPENHDRITHYRSNGKHAPVFDTGLYGKRTQYAGKDLDQPVFVIRKPLAELTPDCLTAPQPDPILDRIKDDESLIGSAALWQERLKREEDTINDVLKGLDGEAPQVRDQRDKTQKRLNRVSAWQGQKPTKARWLDLEKFIFPSAPGNIIFSPKLREHIRLAWANYTADPLNWSRVVRAALDEQKQNLLEAQAKARIVPTTLRAIGKRIGLLEHWLANENPDAVAWEDLQTFLHRESGAMQAKPVFPRDFIAGLRHPDYAHAPLVRVKVTQQTKDESSYVPMREGTYLKYKGGFKCLKVFDAPPQASRGTDFVCWLVRPFYPRRPGGPKKRREIEADNMPEVCRGLKLRHTFRIGDVVRFEHDIPKKGVRAGTNWMLCESMAAGETGARLTLVPAHLALKVRDPIDLKKTLDLKKTHGLDIRLNDFIRALKYEPAHHSSSEP